MRRFTRLTNAFSRKIENHAAMVALYIFAYNFIKLRRSLKNATPAMAAGLADWRMKVEDIVRMLDAGRGVRDSPEDTGSLQETSEGELRGIGINVPPTSGSAGRSPPRNAVDGTNPYRLRCR